VFFFCSVYLEYVGWLAFYREIKNGLETKEKLTVAKLPWYRGASLMCQLMLYLLYSGFNSTSFCFNKLSRIA